MMPAFSWAISVIEEPSQRSWSRPIGVMTATSEPMTFVASQRPPKPTSMTATSTG